MKRPAGGVHFDDGLALRSEEEFEVLFVDARPEQGLTLKHWFHDEAAEALLLGGQIGTGKSTLIGSLPAHFGCTPDITLAFDREVASFSPGGFCGYLFANLVRKCIVKDLAIPEGISPRDFNAEDVSDWITFCRLFTSPPSSIAENQRLREACSKLASVQDMVVGQCRRILEALESNCGRRLRIMAEGIDKFTRGSAELLSLDLTLNILAEYKTIFEVNALHLFGRQYRWQRCPHIFIGELPNRDMEEVLQKRLGSYAFTREDILPAVSSFSAGNPRQALRLLTAYDYAKGKLKRSTEESFGLACQRVRNDFLYLAFESLPGELLTAVKREGFLRAGLLSTPVRDPAHDARQAVYTNWILLEKEPDEGDKWSARLNPLIVASREATESLPPTPEMRAIRLWAENHDTSPFGLDFDTTERTSFDVWTEISSSTSCIGSLNVIELLDAIASGLFTTQRQDRALVAYRDREVMHIARDYMIGKANEAGDFQSVLVKREEVSKGDEESSIISRLDSEHREQAIYCVELPTPVEKKVLQALDKRRDVFADYQVIWWVYADDLLRCLQEWPQMRQLLQVYILEDELLGSLSQEDIESDLAFLNLLDDSDSVERAKKGLKKVLDYLRRRDRK